jgi:hypothetical protein
MVNVVQRNMGVAETGALDLPAVQTARRAAGQDMGNVARTMSIDGNAQVPSGVAGGGRLALTDRLDEIYRDALALGHNTEQAHAADTLRNQINASITNHAGVMPGGDFQRFVASGNTLDRLSDNANTEVQRVAADVRNALFNAADNTAGNPPGVRQAFRDAQLRYKAAMTANDAIRGSGSSDAMTPAALKQAIFRNYSDQLAAGNSGAGYDMPDLGRMIQGIPKLPTSGTGERNLLYTVLSGAGGYLGSPGALSVALHAGAPLAALSAAGRVSRLGAAAVPGGAALAPMVRAVNPLMPRLMGQGVGNLLATGNMPQPTVTR